MGVYRIQVTAGWGVGRAMEMRAFWACTKRPERVASIDGRIKNTRQITAVIRVDRHAVADAKAEAARTLAAELAAAGLPPPDELEALDASEQEGSEIENLGLPGSAE